MSTWHQDRVKYRFMHPTKWTVVEDGPNVMMCISRFDSHEEAEARLELIKPTLTGSYIVVPETVWARITPERSYERHVRSTSKDESPNAGATRSAVSRGSSRRT